MSKIRLISGRSHPSFAKEVAEGLGVKLIPVEAKNFASGEIYFRVKERIRGDDIFLLQTFRPGFVNEDLVELLIAIDAIKRASAERINVVCPYLGYARQDRKSTSREPITAKLVANLITKAGADRLMTIDLHSDQVQGFFDIPVDHFVGYPLFAEYLVEKKYRDLVIVAPDVGAVKKSRRMGKLLDASLAIVDKRRPRHNCAEVLNLIGEVKVKTAVIVDDMIDTAGTASMLPEVLKKNGAREVIICATHGLLSGEAVNRLKNCPAEKILISDTLPLPKEKVFEKLEVISVIPLLTKVIKRIHSGRSLGALFTWEKKMVTL